MPRIVVTIPAYNEENTIYNVVQNIKAVMNNTIDDYRIIVVSDGSTDRTLEAASLAGASIRWKKHTGLADTFRKEMEISLMIKADIIVHTDADGQYRAEDIPRLIKAVENGADLVLGNRLSGKLKNMPTSKKIFNKLGSLFFSLAVQQYIPDFTTGFRAFNCKVAQMPIKSNYTYTIEQIIKAHILGYKIKSINIDSCSRKGGKSHLMKSPIHYIWNTIKNWRLMYKL